MLGLTNCVVTVKLPSYFIDFIYIYHHVGINIESTSSWKNSVNTCNTGTHLHKKVINEYNIQDKS